MSADVFYRSEIVIEVLANEIKWPDPVQREQLRGALLSFHGCIGFIDGIL